MDTYLKGQIIESWLDPRIAVRPSSIEGKGMFALGPIGAGEVVVVWGGVIYTRAEVEAGAVKPGTATRISRDLYLADPDDGTISPDYYLNHSCDPNLWLEDEITLVARRDIQAGEELSIDYALWETDPSWTLAPCRCGTGCCRGRVTGSDWRLKELQAKYRGHFTPYLNELVDCREDADRAE